MKISKNESMNDLHLPPKIISNIFKNSEDIKDFKLILKEIDPTNKIDIFYDRLKLQELFLNLNPQLFSSANFRKTILESNYGTNQFIKFAENFGIHKNEINSANKKTIIKKISKFKWNSNTETNLFISIFGLDESVRPNVSTDELEIEAFPPAQKPYNEMFQYQNEIFFKALNMLKKFNQRFIIQLPTGGGKTKLAMELVCNQLNSKNNQKILWIADRKELCQQAAEAFDLIWRHKGKKKIMLNRCWEEFDFNPNIPDSTLIISTINKILSLKKNGIEINCDIIIFDEAHHSSAPKYNSAILHASKNGTRTIGLTATPGRSIKDREENQTLAQMFDNELLEIKTPENQGVIRFLQKKGILSKPIRKPPILIPKLKSLFTSKELKKIEKKTDYSLPDLEKIGRNHVRNIIIIKKLIEIAETGKQILFFGTSVAQSRLMYAAMKQKGFSGAHIEALTNKDYRYESIQKFKNKKIQILFNNEVLATGFDAPSVEVVFIARPTKSPVLLLQMIGRGMRGKNVGGTETFDLYYLKDGIFENFQNLDELFSMWGDYFD